PRLGGAQPALAALGIQQSAGATGPADAAGEALLAGNLEYDLNVQCGHYEGHHHEGGCGGHNHHGEGHECRHGRCAD
ncbi:MAG: DNA-binding protein, partial [Clostridiales bacterium]|nr:DNA-binding protein [Clostridiales bacterium]